MIVYYSDYNDKDFHKLLKDIALFLKKNYNASIIEDKNKKLIHNDIEYEVRDCELVIYYPETDSYKGITFTDGQSPLIGFFTSRNNSKDLLLCSQYFLTDLRDKIFNFNFKKSIYVPSDPHLSLDNFYVRRLVTDNFIDKFIFRGYVTEGSRISVEILESSQYFEGHGKIQIKDHFEELTFYKVGLSLPGTGELCYRDIEYMAIGIPMMRFNYITDMNPPLIPNYHYIGIDRIDSPEDINYNGGVVAVERIGGERFVKEYIKRFLEVKDDNQFLDFISKNARKYYEDYLHPLTRLNHIIKLLEI